MNFFLDIIVNITEKKFKEEFEKIIKNEGYVIQSNFFTSESIIDDFKIKLLSEAFNKFTLEELESKLA